MREAIVASICAYLLAAALMLSGCSSSSGWTFSIGVSPVNGLQNQQSLDPRVVQARREVERKNY